MRAQFSRWTGLVALALAVATSPAAAGARESDAPPTATRKGGSWDAVGRLNVAGYARRGHCTGALIAPDRVVTAAHCLQDRAGKTAALDDIHFLPGADRGAYLAHGRAACVLRLPRAAPRAATPAQARLAELGADAAVVVLRAPLEIPPARVTAEDGGLRSGAAVLQAGYPRGSAHALAVEGPCAVTAVRGALILTDCPSNHGDSGGPVTAAKTGDTPLDKTGDTPLEVSAIVLARTKTGSIALAASAWRPLLNAPCQ